MSVIHVDFLARIINDEAKEMGAPLSLFEDAIKAKEILNRPSKPRPKPMKVGGFTYRPTKDKYVASNCVYDAKTEEAYSYGWWRFVERIGPYLVFNSYHYSSSTSTHQWKVQSLLEHDLGVTFDITIEAPQGLQNLHSAISLYNRRITALQAAMAKKGSHKAKNAERLKEIEGLKSRIEIVSMLRSLRDAEESKSQASN